MAEPQIFGVGRNAAWYEARNQITWSWPLQSQIDPPWMQVAMSMQLLLGSRQQSSGRLIHILVKVYTEETIAHLLVQVLGLRVSQQCVCVVAACGASLTSEKHASAVLRYVLCVFH